MLAFEVFMSQLEMYSFNSFANYRHNRFYILCGNNSEADLGLLFDHLNAYHQSILFTLEGSKDKIAFLDLQITLTQHNNVLRTSFDTQEGLVLRGFHPWNLPPPNSPETLHHKRGNPQKASLYPLRRNEMRYGRSKG